MATGASHLPVAKESVRDRTSDAKSDLDSCLTGPTSRLAEHKPENHHSDAGDSDDLEDGHSHIIVEGITGPHSEYVILISSDFHEFIIKRRAAYVSPTLKRILDQRNKAVRPSTVSEVLVNYPSLVVNKIAEYLVYKEYFERTQEDAPKFRVEPAMVLEVLLASQFLDI